MSISLASCLQITGWGNLVDDEKMSPAAQAMKDAETRAVMAMIHAKRLADAQTPEGFAAATAEHRSIFRTFLLRHIQHNISRAKVLGPVKPSWRILYENQINRAQADQDRLDSYDCDMWSWVHDQDEYKNMTEIEFEAYGTGFSQYWEEKYEDWLQSTIPKDPHRDAEGNIETCRYFNTAVGCHPPEGQRCPYRHVAGKAPEPDECKFFHTPRGCRSGDACPFKHTTASASATAAAAPLDFAAARGGGGSWRSVPSANSGWEVAGSKPRVTEPCKFFKTTRGCKNGRTCPHPHI